MRLREIFKNNGNKWDSIILHNQNLRIKYFKPIFNTSDNLAIGTGDDGCGLEFSLDDHDGWEDRPPEPQYLDYYRVAEAYRIKDKGYITVYSKEWHPNIADALSVYKKDGFYITKVLVEKKLINWSDDTMYTVERVSNEAGKEVEVEEIL